MEFVSGAHVVVAPYGLPSSTSACEACCRILLGCGGDLRRVIEGDPRTPTSIARRLPGPGPAQSAPAPLVVLARTTPVVIAVMRLRQILEQAAPHLGRAPWLVFHDAESHPTFLETATSLGGLDSELGLAPFWYAPDGKTYIVISRHVAAVRFVRERIRMLLDAGDAACDVPPDSQVRPIFERSLPGQRRGGDP